VGLYVRLRFIDLKLKIANLRRQSTQCMHEVRCMIRGSKLEVDLKMLHENAHLLASLALARARSTRPGYLEEDRLVAIRKLSHHGNPGRDLID